MPGVSARVAANAVTPGSDPEVRVNSRDVESDIVANLPDKYHVSIDLTNQTWKV